jgi:SAM-dependent methyltransferase
MSHLALHDPFDQWYDPDKWVGSGPGSQPEYTTDYRGHLRRIIDGLDGATIVDVGCGDWQFMWLVMGSYLDLGMRYLGIDVVPSVVERNRKLFRHPGLQFHTWETAPKKIECDLAICKDVMQHLPRADREEILARVKPKKWLLVNDFKEGVNPEIERGGNTTIDPVYPPFRFKTVREVCRFPKGKTDKRAFLCWP